MKKCNFFPKFTVILTLVGLLNFGFSQKNELSIASGFNKNKDLILAQFDCKTDVDDLHAIAAFATTMADPKFSNIKYYAVAGTYGVQEGLYVPPNSLFKLAFGDRWADAHENLENAIRKVMQQIQPILANGGDIWIAEAGQSDFTANLVKAIESQIPNIAVDQRLHVVQHSNWNERSTAPGNLELVKQTTDYQKIPDGNVPNNGSPNFREDEFILAEQKIKNSKLLKIWQEADRLCTQFNGMEGRYDNEAISNGGVDFSDLAETCYILGLNKIKDSKEFFSRFLN